MNEGGLLRPALIGGVLLGIVSVVPILGAFNCLCCAWVIGGGVLAAYFYVHGAPAMVSLGRGATLGLLTGAIGAVVDTLFSVPTHLLIARFGDDTLGPIRQILERFSELPPEARELFERLFSRDPASVILHEIFNGIVKLIVYPIMAMLGGAIGVALFEKRRPGDAIAATDVPTPSPLPPPPPPDVTPPQAE
jgi:hypothetical protein